MPTKKSNKKNLSNKKQFRDIPEIPSHSYNIRELSGEKIIDGENEYEEIIRSVNYKTKGGLIACERFALTLWPTASVPNLKFSRL